MKSTRITIEASVILLLATAYASGQTPELPIDSIVRARITSDGDVAGRATDFLINLGVPNDNRPGFTLPAGNRFEVILPPEFVNDREVIDVNTGMSTAVQTETVFTSNSCAIGNFVCNTSVFVQGWPQRPLVTVFPIAGRNSPDDFQFDTEIYLLSNGENENHFIHEARIEVGPGSVPPGPGIKQIHMILPGFSNPTVSEPTDFPITVRETRMNEAGDVEVLREGIAPFTVIPDVQPSINLTSVFDPMRRNTVFQQIAPGTQPLRWDFYLWNGEGTGYEGVSIDGTNFVDANQDVIGRVSVSGPEGATGHSVTSASPSELLDGGDVFFNLSTARLTAQLAVGDVAGDYVTTFEIFAKDEIGMPDPSIVSSETLTVRVVPEPGGLGLMMVGLFGFASLRRRRRIEG